MPRYAKAKKLAVLTLKSESHHALHGSLNAGSLVFIPVIRKSLTAGLFVPNEIPNVCES